MPQTTLLIGPMLQIGAGQRELDLTFDTHIKIQHHHVGIGGEQVARVCLWRVQKCIITNRARGQCGGKRDEARDEQGAKWFHASTMRPLRRFSKSCVFVCLLCWHGNAHLQALQPRIDGHDVPVRPVIQRYAVAHTIRSFVSCVDARAEFDRVAHDGTIAAQP